MEKNPDLLSLRREFERRVFLNGEYLPDEFGPKTCIFEYRIEKAANFLDMVLDGKKSDWLFGRVSQDRSDIFYSCLRELVGDGEVFWASFLCHDCAVWEFRRFQMASSDTRYLRHVGSSLLMGEPAEEGGITAVCLYSKQLDFLIEFSDQLGYSINYYGSPDSLARFSELIKSYEIA